jgi:CDP-diacylglycerol--serine O-phosphatidyltransferase
MVDLFHLPGGQDPKRHRRGVYLLPSIVTVGNIFCGYACIVYAMRGELATAAPFIGIAVVLDMLDGRLARLTNTTSAFGVEFDSLADVISFGIAPAMLAFAWGLDGLGRVGWAAGFVFVSAAAIRLARFNIQSGAHQLDKRYFVGMPTPAAAGVAAATIYAFPARLETYPQTLAAVGIMLVPAVLMVSTVRFRSFKSINFGWGPSYAPLFAFILFVAFVATEPRVTLLILSYGYLLSAFVGLAITRLRNRKDSRPPASAA